MRYLSKSPKSYKYPSIEFLKALKNDNDCIEILKMTITKVYKDLCGITEGTSKSLQILECISLKITDDLCCSNF